MRMRCFRHHSPSRRRRYGESLRPPIGRRYWRIDKFGCRTREEETYGYIRPLATLASRVDLSGNQLDDLVDYWIEDRLHVLNTLTRHSSHPVSIAYLLTQNYCTVETIVVLGVFDLHEQAEMSQSWTGYVEDLLIPFKVVHHEAP